MFFNMRTIFRSSIAIFLFALTFSCNRDKAPDISSINVDIKIRRFDQEIFNIDLSSVKQEITELSKSYPHFFPLYNFEIIEIGNSMSPAYPDMLTQFINNFSVYKAYQATLPLFKDMSGIEDDLNKCFSYYRYYFPEKNIPEVVSFIGGFNQSVVTDENLLGIGLDKYLGSKNEIYQLMAPPFPDYFLYRMRPEFIPVDCMKGWLYSEIPFNDSLNNLVNNMIYEGIIAYALQKTMPDTHDTILFGYTPSQLEFCENNEVQMWTYLIENKLLFETNSFMIRQFVGEAPFTKGFSPDSPGKAIQWLGLQIVESYVKKNKLTGLKALTSQHDYLKILNNSGYNP